MVTWILKLVVFQVLYLGRVGAVLGKCVHPMCMRLIDLCINVASIGWGCYAMWVLFAPDNNCKDDAKLLWVALVIIFVDTCVKIAGCLCIICCLIVLCFCFTALVGGMLASQKHAENESRGGEQQPSPVPYSPNQPHIGPYEESRPPVAPYYPGQQEQPRWGNGNDKNLHPGYIGNAGYQ